VFLPWGHETTAARRSGPAEGGDAMMPNESNMLLRAAYAIAERKGEDTNWDAFKSSVENVLFDQAGLVDLGDEQTRLRVTCTARTYRLPKLPQHP